MLAFLPEGSKGLESVGMLPDLARISAECLEQSGNGSAAPKKKKRTKGWDGEMDPGPVIPPLNTMNGASAPQVLLRQHPIAVSDDGSPDPLFTTQRVFNVSEMPEGGLEAHITVRCSLVDIARATNLRLDDVAFAMQEFGLLTRGLSEVGRGESILISKRMVEKVAEERNVKKPCIDLQYVLL